MVGNRERVLHAAVELLAEKGIRGLTHLQVDSHAALPKGSTSNIFRSRAALLLGVAQHMATREQPAVIAGFSAESADELIESLTQLFHNLVTAGRTTTTARLVLFTEAIHDSEVRDALLAGWSLLRVTVRPALVRLGSPDPDFGVQAIAVCFEGMFIQVLGRGADVSPERHLAIAVRGALFA